MKDVRRSHH